MAELCDPRRAPGLAVETGGEAEHGEHLADGFERLPRVARRLGLGLLAAVAGEGRPVQ